MRWIQGLLLWQPERPEEATNQVVLEGGQPGAVRGAVGSQKVVHMDDWVQPHNGTQQGRCHGPAKTGVHGEVELAHMVTKRHREENALGACVCVG